MTPSPSLYLTFHICFSLSVESRRRISKRELFFFNFSRKPPNLSIPDSSLFQILFLCGSSWPALCTKFQLKKLTLAFPFLSYILHFNISPFLISPPLFFVSSYICPKNCVPFNHRMCARFKHDQQDIEKNMKTFGKWSKFEMFHRPWMSIRLQNFSSFFFFSTSRHAWLIDQPILP